MDRFTRNSLLAGTEGFVAGKASPIFHELTDPAGIVTLAATTLTRLHPDVDKMFVLIAVRKALRKLVNAEIKARGEEFTRFVTRED